MPEHPQDRSGEPSRAHYEPIPEVEFAKVQRLDPIGFDGGVRRTDLRIEGMDCPDEVELLERALKPLPGVRSVEANILASRISIIHDPATDTRELIAAIAPTGLKALPADEESREEATKKGQRARWLSVGASGACTAAGLLLGWLHLAPEAVQIGCYLAAILAGGWLIFPKALMAARQLRLDMNVLMTVAIAGAVLIGQWSEAGAVVFLFALAEMLEAFSVQRARQAIRALMQLTPATALVLRGGEVREEPVHKVAPGTMIAVKSGQRVPLDGEISCGVSTINQAPITGESMPVEKTVGDPVFAGTINGAGALEVRVTQPASDTMLARIIHLVEEAQTQKAPAQRFVDTFAAYYTPAVFALAVLVALAPPLLAGGVWSVWIYRALVLLVIACPCALVISTPVSIVSGLTAMARRGVLIKGGVSLEAVGKLRALAVDKTGTITEGQPRVVRILPVAAPDEATVLRCAAALDSHSEHPLARAVIEAARERGITFPRSEAYQARPGRGAEGALDGVRYFVGNHRFAHELGVCSPELERQLEEIEAETLSVTMVGRLPGDGDPGEVLGVLAIGDTVRADAAEALRALHAAGLEKVVMLSGDNQRTVDAIARRAGIDEARGDLLPEQKLERVHDLLDRYGSVGMIGDGVNDAPAMAAASVGIAMGAGTDTALEAADMTLMTNDLGKVAEAIHLGRRTVRIIQFNIAFSLAIKALFLLLALFGYTSLWLAIAADTGATLLVVMNSLRLLRAE